MSKYTRFNVLRLSAVLLVLFSLNNLQAQKGIPAVQTNPLTIGETLTFASKTLGEERRLNVYLPASYSDSVDAKYPVIYLLDGSYTEDLYISWAWSSLVPIPGLIGCQNPL